MSRKYNVFIKAAVVVADTEEQAKELADELLQELAGSNDGSELLANADPFLTEGDMP